MNATTENIETAITPAAVASTRPFYWAVRREFWEHRALWMAPLIAAALIVLSFIVNAVHMSEGEMLATLQPARLRAISAGFFGAVSAVIAITMLTVTFFYCLDALYSERRDRSILFWKSLPVSDVTTVTSKLFVATAGASAIAFVIVVATQLVILILGMIIIALAGGSAWALWSSVSMLQLSMVLLYVLAAQALWFAPVTAWLIFVSSWVRRSPFMWAVLIPAGVAMVERLAFGTSYLVTALGFREIKGFMQTAFSRPDEYVAQTAVAGNGFNLQLELPDRIFDSIDAVRFFSSAQVWVGLALAVALVAATVWMRRYREPL